MTRAMLRRRLSEHVDEDERGFTIIETMIAITIIFAGMVAMAYTATLGFHSIAYGRERVTADGIADQVLETIRGQAYSKIQTGLSSSDLADPYHPRAMWDAGRLPIPTVRRADREFRRRAYHEVDQSSHRHDPRGRDYERYRLQLEDLHHQRVSLGDGNLSRDDSVPGHRHDQLGKRGLSRTRPTTSFRFRACSPPAAA